MGPLRIVYFFLGIMTVLIPLKTNSSMKFNFELGQDQEFKLYGAPGTKLCCEFSEIQRAFILKIENKFN